ncbi:hypothetical protein [Empedobacter brevis]|uniref:Uncharacterized protein n=1 Tax=Empedobacter brevis NBRC 14943 = ATCC 43319 TaxID=1218108 RepID=A0A511NFH6_9FLAO|nr:hypothetical protein [Empedobacter brevis]GEM51346.1 hypothetical protein EB1_11360 [Empedobacter brevis NBRC 14943 = ATCC 43319]
MDLENITKIDSIVYANVEISSKNSYLIYSVKDKIIVIDSCKREVIYLNREESKQVLEMKELSHENTVKLFKVKNIKKSKNYSNNDYDNSCIGSYVYLSIIKNKEKYFQFNLPFMLLCDKNKIRYPFDYKTLNFLNLLLNKQD